MHRWRLCHDAGNAVTALRACDRGRLKYSMGARHRAARTRTGKHQAGQNTLPALSSTGRCCNRWLHTCPRHALSISPIANDIAIAIVTVIILVLLFFLAAAVSMSGRRRGEGAVKRWRQVHLVHQVQHLCIKPGYRNQCWTPPPTAPPPQPSQPSAPTCTANRKAAAAPIHWSTQCHQRVSPVPTAPRTRNHSQYGD